MKSKAEVVRESLTGKRVIDIGGSGYGDSNKYEAELAEAWGVTERRFVVDSTDNADLQCDLNKLPLPELPTAEEFDIAIAFDVLEHLEHPVEILRWIPTAELIVSLPNGLSPIALRMEQHSSKHLYNFTPWTVSNMLQRGGWCVDKYYYTLGKWSLLARLINCVGSLCPPLVATGIMFHCTRIHNFKKSKE